MSKKIKFLLVGHGGFSNRGCEAIVRTTILLLKQFFPDSVITLTSFEAEEDRKKLNGEVRVVAAQNDAIWHFLTPSWFLRKFCSLCAPKYLEKLSYLPIEKEIKRSDVVLQIGGDNFTSDYERFPEYYFKLNEIAKKHKKILIIWAASVGPFKENSKVDYAIRNLKTVDLITIRESASYSLLQQLGVTDNIARVADTAFLLPSESISFEKKTENIVGLSVSCLLGRYSDQDSNNLLQHLKQFIEYVTSVAKFSFVFIPHVTRKSPLNNDFNFLRNLYDCCNNKKMITLLPPYLNAMQLKYIISQCRFFIGARTHSTIAAFSTNVPTISLGYSLKSKGINTDLFGDEKYVLAISDFSCEALIKKFYSLLEDEDQIKAELQKKIPIMKHMAMLNAVYLKKLIN